jgi:hypothetical protein
MTKTEVRPLHDNKDDMPIRLAALLIRSSSAPLTSQHILAPLATVFDYFPLATMVRAADKNYQERSILANFESEEFWITENLEDWLSAWSEVLCHAVWHTSPCSSVWELTRAMSLVLSTLPQVHSFPSREFEELNFRLNRT